MDNDYAQLFKTIPVGVVVTDMKGNILDANPAYQEMLGYGLDELKALTYQDITPEKWHKTEEEIVSKVFDEKYARFEKEYMRKDGTVFPVEITGWITRDEEGQPMGTASIVRNISE